MGMANIAILCFFFFVMSVGGLALFFGSDYAQKRWGAEDSPDSDKAPLLEVVADYRVRKQ
jgi:hypothetical protein